MELRWVPYTRNLNADDPLFLVHIYDSSLLSSPPPYNLIPNLPMILKASHLIKLLQDISATHDDPEVWIQVHLDNNPSFQVYGERFAKIEMEDMTRGHNPPICVIHMNG